MTSQFTTKLECVINLIFLKLNIFRIFPPNSKQKVDLNLLQIELGKGLGKGGLSIKSLKAAGYEGIFVGIGKLL